MTTAIRIARVLFAVYWLTLTVLLLVPDPLALLLGVMPDASIPSRGTHFTAFFLLAILAGSSRLPWRLSLQTIALFVYAVTTESLQGLVEGRVVELLDYAENLLGLAVGTTAWILAYKAWKNWQGRQEDSPKA